MTIKIFKLFLLNVLLLAFSFFALTQEHDEYDEDEEYTAEVEEEEEEEEEEEYYAEEEQQELEKSKKMSRQRARQNKEQLKNWFKQLEAFKAKRGGKESTLLNLVSNILNHEPNNIQALNTLGTFYLERGKTQLAKIIFTRALKKHPKNSALRNNLGIIALKQGDQKTAIDLFQKSLKSKYSNYSAGANLGTLYMKSYEYELALEPLELAYGRGKRYLSPNHYEVLKTGNNYAVALAWAGYFDKAEDVFEELAKKNHKGIVEIFLNYAILLGKDLKSKGKALDFLQKADLMDKSGRYARKIRTLRQVMK